MRFHLIPALSLLFAMPAFAAGNWQLASPDKKITLTVSNKDKSLTYSVKLAGKTVLEESPLGIVTEETEFYRNLISVHPNSKENGRVEYSLALGDEKTVDKDYTEQVFRLKNESGEDLDVVFRVENGGVAYCYRFAEPQTVEREYSGFALPASSNAFLTPLSKAKSGWCETNPSYEDHYQCRVPLATLSDYRQGWIFPALFEVGNAGWVLLSETGVDSGYVASHLSECKNGTYMIEFPHADHNLPEDPATAAMKGNSTPWRTIAIGETPKEIVESTLMQDLVEPKYKSKVDFKPGLASWSWLVCNDSNTTYEGTKEYIDMAAELGLPYCLIDALWDTQIGRGKMEELAKYAAAKNVGLLLWYNSNGNWNSAPQSPKNIMNISQNRKKEMAWMQKIGIKGIKVDFFGGDKQAGMQLYEDILRDANDYGLACVFHGCTLPRGWERMFPNFVTAEAVMGQEFCKSDQHNENLRPQHCTILPYTRNVAAPMDFTPVVLNKYLGEKPGQGAKRTTTAAFELALPVIFFSPITHLGIVPDNLKEFPKFVWDYISNLPTVWDETRYLSGYPGSDIVMARKKGGHWYIAGINGENKPKTIEVDLSFLPKSSQAKIIATSSKADNNSLDIKQVIADKNNKIKIELGAYDGFVIKN